MTLSFQDVSVSYGKNKVLRNLSFDPLRAGQMVGLIGPNAAGKSTLFKTIAGLIRPKAGEILLDGTDLMRQGRRVRASRVAYMPQACCCGAFLSVFESVLLALKQTSGWRVKDENIAHVEATLRDLELLHLAERGLSELSGGQAQMVAVARTLVRNPELVLLDEPTSSLDLHHQLSIMMAVRQAISSRGITGMVALHDLNLAAEFCDRLMLIRAGEILADGLPGQVLASPDVNDTYRVETTLEQTRRGSLYVDARLSVPA